MPTPSRRVSGTIAAVLLAIWPASGCLSPIGTTAASALRKAKESPDPNIRHLAYERLGVLTLYDDDNQKAEAAKLLATALDNREAPIASRAVICRSLGALRRPEARPALIRAIDDQEPLVRAEACRALGRVGSPEDALALARIMAADTSIDCRVAAIEGIGALKSTDPRMTTSLVEGMQHQDPAIRLASLQALRTITGKDLGTEPGPWKKAADESVAAKAEATAVAEKVDATTRR